MRSARGVCKQAAGKQMFRLNRVAELFVGGLMLGAPYAALAQAPATPSAPASTERKAAEAEKQPDTGKLERVTVTAERRLTVLDETPAAITALSGSKLTEQGATNLADVVTLAPNTTFTTGQNTSQLFVRGIGNVFILAGGDPGVAMYNDGAYISDQTSSNVALFDTQRVEVLRGPQGALYGRNATGGAMNIISALPTDTFAARVGLLFGSFGRKETEGFVSSPVGGSTSVRLSFQAREQDGYTKNPLAGTVSPGVVAGLPSTTAPARLDDLSSRALRVQSMTGLSENASLRLIASHYHQDDAGPSSAGLIEPISNASALFGAQPSTDPRVVKSQGSINKVEVNSFLGIYEHNLRSSVLTFTASYRKSGTDHDYDGDVTEASVIQTRFITKSKDKSVDLHLASNDASALQWLVGATALEFDQRQDVRVSAQVPVGFLVPGAPLNFPLPGGVDVLLGGLVRTSSIAAYADLRYALSPKLALLGGIRVNRDRKEAQEYLNIAAFGLAGTGTPSDSWTSVPGSIGVEYKFSPETMAYGRLSHGFKSGAVNLGSLQPNLVKPERVTSAEIGLKTDFWDRRGSFNIAAFSSDYKDMQVSQVGTATVILANASKARINGLEVELALRPIPQLTVNANLGLMDPEYTDFVNTDLRNNPTQAVNVRGNQLAQVSKAQFNLGAEYVATLGGYKASIRGDYVWRSKFYFTEFNTPDAEQDDYGLFHLSAWLRPAKGNWKVYGYVRNAGDKTAVTSLLIAAPFLASGRQVTYTRPREFGIGLVLDF